MTTKPEGIVRLGRAVRDRRTELRMTQDDVARAGGPSDVTVRNLESASVSRVNAATLGKLDVALQWEPGTSSAHLQGTAEQPVGTAPAPVLLHDASDSALLAEIARRFDLTRSSREPAPHPTAATPAPNRDDLADPALRDGATSTRADWVTHPAADDRPWEQDDYDLAAKRGRNRGREARQQQDREAEDGGA